MVANNSRKSKISDVENLSTIIMGEIIGLNAKVINSSDVSQIGISGIIKDETKNTLVISTPKGMKKIIKKISKFEIRKGKFSYIIDGRYISFKPEERTQKSMKFLDSKIL
ncbi:MAG: ribonuclease P protein component 1 [Candidatus Micrarchaeia archaeon]